MAAAPGTLAVSLGRAFAEADFEAEAVQVDTHFGQVVLHRLYDQWVLFRHGRGQQRLPHQIQFRAHAAALHAVGVQSLVSTGTVALLNDKLPLHEPLLVKDIVMATDLLPDGTPCTMFLDQPGGHLHLGEGLLSSSLKVTLRGLARAMGAPLNNNEVVVTHIPGPRARTRAEIDLLAARGTMSVSLTLAPELVLANEVGIATAAVVVGHGQLPEGPRVAHAERRIAEATRRLEDVCAIFLRGGKAAKTTTSLQHHGAPPG